MSTGNWGYGATVARVTPDQKVGSSNLSALTSFGFNAICYDASCNKAKTSARHAGVIIIASQQSAHHIYAKVDRIFLAAKPKAVTHTHAQIQATSSP